MSHPSVAVTVDLVGRADGPLPRDIETGLNQLLAQLGIPGAPVVSLNEESGTEELRIAVHGIVQPYPRALLRRLEAFGPGEDPGAGHVQARMVIEIVKQRPETLLGDEQVAAYVEPAGRSIVEPNPLSLPVDRVKNILSYLLGMRLSIEESPLVISRIAQGIEQGRSDADITESLISRLAPRKIEIEIASVYAKQLFDIELRPGQRLSVYNQKIGADVQTLFRILTDGLFYELGIRIPDIEIVVSDSLNTGAYTFRLNHLTCATTLGIKADQLLVNETSERLVAEGITALPAVNPANGNECALIAAEFKDRVKSKALTTWDAVGYLILTLAREIRGSARSFVHAEVVEYELAQLHSVFPDLIDAVMEKVPLTRLTRALREMADEEISIRDLKAILDRILTADFVVADFNLIVFDDRLTFHTEPSPEWRDDGHSLVQQARAGLKRYISHKYTRGQSTLIVYLIDQSIEKVLLDHLAFERGIEEKPSLTADRIDEIRQAVRKEVGDLPSAVALPAILTSPEIRYSLRQLIAQEFPEMTVLSFDELSPDLNIQPIARISLDS